MDIRSILKSQYRAALKTLRECIEKCPPEMWDDPADAPAPFWRVAYHTLFFTHYYLQKDKACHHLWDGHRAEANLLGAVPWDNFRPPLPCQPYTPEELLAYLQLIDDAVTPLVDAADLEASDCGFPWYKMGKLEHQLVNIRHTQHHAAILTARLRTRAKIGIDWVAKG